MIREAVRESLEEQVSGLPGASGRGGAKYMGGTAGRPERMGAMTSDDVDLSSGDINKLVAMMKNNADMDDETKARLKKRIVELLKAAGW